MYLSYYGFKKMPFHITPDPEFLYLTPSHKEALATIRYGVEAQKGFIVITGEVGTGKTTTLREFLLQSTDDTLEPIYVFDPYLSFEELLRSMLLDMGEEVEDTSPSRMLVQLQHRLIEEYEDGRDVVLLIDEAQNMPVETLEKLRVISNLETNDDKLIQIVLIGQPELDEKLNRHELRQLNQRVALRAKIHPLTRKQSAEYIRHRINCAWGKCDTIFTRRAMRSIVDLGKGMPRKINILCDNVLIAGYGSQHKPVDRKLVKAVARDMELPVPGLVTRGKLIFALICILIGTSIGTIHYGQAYLKEHSSNAPQQQQSEGMNGD